MLIQGVVIMYNSCIEKQQIVKALFANCSTDELKYQKIIEFGRNLQDLPFGDKTPENIVAGCQSTMYLSSKLENDVVIFWGESDALISAGLAALLIMVYSGEPPEAILKCPPDYLEALGIGASLTPNRANGLHSIHLRMKQEALKHYMRR